MKDICPAKKSSNNLDSFSDNNFSIFDSINNLNTVNSTMVYDNINTNNEISTNLNHNKLHKENFKSNEKTKNSETIFKKFYDEPNIEKTKNLSNICDHKTIFVNSSNNLSNIKKLYFSNPKKILTGNKSLKTMKFTSKKNATLNPTTKNCESCKKNYIFHRYKKFAPKKNNHWVKNNENRHNTLVVSPNETFLNTNSNNINNISNTICNKTTEYPNILRNNIYSFKKLPFHPKQEGLKRQLSNIKSKDDNNLLCEKNNFNILVNSDKQNKNNNICNTVVYKQKVINHYKIKIDEKNSNNNYLNKENIVKYAENSDLLNVSNINSFDNENKNFLNFKDSKYNTANKENENNDNSIQFKKKVIKNNSIVNKLNIFNNSNKIMIKNENIIFFGK